MSAHGTAERIRAGDAILDGDLTIPDNASGIVIFAHGSGSSRKSTRNRYVADVLNHAGLATLLLDLLTRDEEEIDLQTAELRFDIPFLAERINYATDHVRGNPETAKLPVGYFGASTGGGAALIAAAQRNDVSAVVSRGGRPDLAMEYLPSVETPTLLIVGGNDDVVIEMNETAMRAMPGIVRLEIVPGATHLFEEPGALEAVAHLATEWFKLYLQG